MSIPTTEPIATGSTPTRSGHPHQPRCDRQTVAQRYTIVHSPPSDGVLSALAVGVRVRCVHRELARYRWHTRRSDSRMEARRPSVRLLPEWIHPHVPESFSHGLQATRGRPRGRYCQTSLVQSPSGHRISWARAGPAGRSPKSTRNPSSRLMVPRRGFTSAFSITEPRSASSG